VAEQLQLEIASPYNAAPPIAVEKLILPGTAGVMTVLPGHTPLLTSLGYGVIVAHLPKGEQRFFAIHGGYAEILDNKVLILADIFEPGTSIDRARAEAAAERAQDRIRKPADNTDFDRAEIALARALARIQAVEKQGY
jgi:F-type H+-transporting ATPase subunit epsilon